MAVNLWGRDPSGKPRAYVIHVNPNDITEYRQKAEAEGWTDLTTGKYEDPETLASESSESQSSPTPRRRRSRTSDAASPDSVTN